MFQSTRVVSGWQMCAFTTSLTQATEGHQGACHHWLKSARQHVRYETNPYYYVIVITEYLQLLVSSRRRVKCNFWPIATPVVRRSRNADGFTVSFQFDKDRRFTERVLIKYHSGFNVKASGAPATHCHFLHNLSRQIIKTSSGHSKKSF